MMSTEWTSDNLGQRHLRDREFHVVRQWRSAARLGVSDSSVLGARLPLQLLVDRSNTGPHSGGSNGQTVDVVARRRVARSWLDESNHLAKVRVARSNPVFRSIGAAQRGV